MLDTAAPVCTTVDRTVPRYVLCEHCGEEYVYELNRTGYGEAGFGLTSDQNQVYVWAVRAAWVDLDRKLATGAEAVPCPSCHKYQRHMLPAARALRWGWVRRLGGQALVALPIVAVAAVMVAVIAFPNRSNLPLVLAGATMGAFLLAGALAAFAFKLAPCDPNRWSEHFRAEQADSLACPRSQFIHVARDGGPFAADLTTGREAEYEGVAFLWVLPEEIAEEAVVGFGTADGREVDVELSDADDDGVFLDADRVDDPDAPEGTTYRICLRVFSLYQPESPTRDAGPE